MTLHCHYSICVSDAETAAEFYIKVFGGRLALRDGTSCHVFVGDHHIVIHQVAGAGWIKLGSESSGAPIPHFGLIVDRTRYIEIFDHAASQSDLLMEPTRRRIGTIYEHECFFVQDPASYPWEIKCYLNATAT